MEKLDPIVWADPERRPRRVQGAQFGHIVADCLDAIRSRRPLIHHITNLVVTNFTANATLAIGAAPVMAHAREEVAEMVGAASALVLNLGTLTPSSVESMLVAGRRANELGIPVVLDPVGVGATEFRTETARRLLSELKVTIVRGNAGEVGALSGRGGEVRGVDSLSTQEQESEIRASGRTLASRSGAVVAITGRHDFVTTGYRSGECSNGHWMLTTVAGTGCVATTLVAACAAVEPDPLMAALAGLVALGLAGELAAVRAAGPGSFQTELLDALYLLNRGDLAYRTMAWIDT